MQSRETFNGIRLWVSRSTSESVPEDRYEKLAKKV
jgi:hypothetical protein